MIILEAALKYAEKGYSVIPVGQDKKPLIKWEPYQKVRASEKEIKQWWTRFPSANIGIVTGEISNLLVVDTDTPEATHKIQEAIPDSLTVPCQSTPSGGMHFVFAHSPGFVNRARVLDGIDIRTSGGYFCAAPSVNGDGKGWQWVVSPLDADPPNIEIALASIIKSFSFSLYRDFVDKKNDTSLQMSTMSTNVYNLFNFHTRNQDLFHVSLQLLKSKTANHVILQVIDNLGKICRPPWGSQADDEPIEKIIESARKYYLKAERNLAEEIRQEVLSTEGDFLSTNIEKCLQLSTREEKKNLSIILKRLSEENPPLCKRKGTRHGSWTTIDSKIEIMDFLNVNLKNTVPLVMPLDIHKKTVFFPKSIIILAGVTGYGKTTFALNFITKNWNTNYEIYYFNSEMSAEALNKKISYFKDYTIEQWFKRIKAIGGWDHRNIASKIFPDAINVVDYLEPESGEPYGIHGVIVEIVNKLNKGIAFITIQKKPGAHLGTGGIYSVKAASLAINLEWGNIHIFKNRFREEDPRPDLDMVDFDIESGSEIKMKDGWYNAKSGKNKPDKYKSFDGGD